eukprot:scaffold41929_cov65-Phaeocystis_antarctica.AAC.4
MDDSSITIGRSRGVKHLYFFSRGVTPDAPDTPDTVSRCRGDADSAAVAWFKIRALRRPSRGPSLIACGV